MRVESYGTGTQVRLPGRSAMEPQIFKFGTPYAEMYRSLAATPEDEAYFLHNGVLQLCKRGAAVKVRGLFLLHRHQNYVSLVHLSPTVCRMHSLH